MRSLHRPRRNHGCRATEAEIDGMPYVTLENEPLRVGVLAGKGADVLELLHKPSDTDFCWARAAPLANPARRPASAPDAAATYLDHYPGGWQEVLPNGGPPSAAAGAAYGQHGEAHLLPWDHDVLVDEPGEVAVRFRARLRRTPLLVERTLSLRAGEATLRIDQRLVNESDVELRAMWGHHVVFGAPFLRPGTRIRLPEGARIEPHRGLGAERRVAGDAAPFAWPLAPAAGGGAPVDLSVVPERGAPGEMLYALDLPEGWYEIGDRDRPSLRLEWDAAVLPHLWIWQELGAGRDWPFWGEAYVVGLEPFSSHPTDGLQAAIANGSALRIAPRAELALAWSARVLPDGLAAA